MDYLQIAEQNAGQLILISNSILELPVPNGSEECYFESALVMECTKSLPASLVLNITDEEVLTVDEDIKRF